MELTPQQITDASNYWSKFRKLPIGNAEMIMHLATYANKVLNESSTSELNEVELMAIEEYKTNKLSAVKFLMHESNYRLKEANDFLDKHTNI
jgi:hypothetical protein